jgi:hypothetical protein
MTALSGVGSSEAAGEGRQAATTLAAWNHAFPSRPDRETGLRR